MPKRGENIYKRKDGRWEGRYVRSRNENGKAIYGYVYGKTYNGVKQKLLLMKALPQQSEKRRAQAILYGQLLDDWLHSSGIAIKESTYARYAT